MRSPATMYVPAEAQGGPSAEVQAVYQEIRDTGRQLAPGVRVLVRRYHNDPDRRAGVVKSVTDAFYGKRVDVRIGRRVEIVAGDMCEVRRGA